MIVTAVLLVSSCNLDQLTNPNELSPEQADAEYILNGIKLGVKDMFFDFTQPTMQLTRMTAAINGKSYNQQFTVTSFDKLWLDMYTGVLINCRTLAEKSGVTPEQLATSQILQAYMMMVAVDLFGDVPYSEALDPENFNPALDKGADIYPKALALLNEAIFTLGGAKADNQWVRIANTLKLRYYLNTRLVSPTTSKSEIQKLIDSQAVLIDQGTDWTFEYGTNLSAPDTRSSWYKNNYTSGASDYMSNSYMFALYNGGVGGNPDPRIRYYIYRQIDAPSTDVNALPCVNNPVSSKPWLDPKGAYCQVAAGYWGRDHLNDDGIPPDGKLRATWGVYPAGGRFDADQNEPAALGQGAGGAGSLPMLMGSFTDFMLAEAAMTLGTSGDPKALLASAIRKSLETTRSYADRDTEFDALTKTAYGMTDGDINNYLTKAMADYDASSDKLNYLIYQYWLAGFGNGIEIYNAYRRTGKPTNLQHAYKTADPGAFYRSLIYPNSYLSRNSNAPAQKKQEVQVFWDTNPAGFIY